MTSTDRILRKISLGGGAYRPSWLARRWMRFWARNSGAGPVGRLASRLAAWVAPPHLERVVLSRQSLHGYIDAAATVYHSDLHLGRNVYIGPGVQIFETAGGGPVILGDRVVIHRNAVLEAGRQGAITLGADSSIHPGCQLKAYMAPILIGEGVMIAANVALYSYDHGIAPDLPIRQQAIVAKGPITIENEVWVGTAAIILSGVTIGEGAVVAAGAVVNMDVPAGAIAAGNPARIVKHRNELEPGNGNGS
jgi:acetyltransferase-like isoleucine patch superfamily enzyme